MKSKFIVLSILSITIFGCNVSREDMLKKLNPTKDSPSISSVALRDNYDNFKEQPVVFEGVVGMGCCGSREIALIDLEDFIQSNGDNIHISLNFNKDELQLVRSYSTGMFIKVVGFVGNKSKGVLWESNYNKGMEITIDLNDCKILNSNLSSNNISEKVPIANEEVTKNGIKNVMEPGEYLVNASEEDKVYFYSNPDLSKIKKSYFTTVEKVNVKKFEANFGYIEFINSEGQMSKGWVIAQRLRANK